jgi:acyl carrier protein
VNYHPEDKMDLNPTITLDDVKAVVVETLGIEDRAATIDASTPLLGSLPELDSLAVAELVVAFEGRFGVVFDGEDVTAEAFETLGTLTELVAGKLA